MHAPQVEPTLLHALFPVQPDPVPAARVLAAIYARTAQTNPLTLTGRRQAVTLRRVRRQVTDTLTLVRVRRFSGTGHVFRPDRQIHVNLDPIRTSPAEAALYDRIAAWGRTNHFVFWGQSHGVWVYRERFDDEWAWFALSVRDAVLLPPGITWPLPADGVDPCDPPAVLQPLFPQNRLAPRMVLADLLHQARAWGFSRVRWVTAITDGCAPPDPATQPARAKTLLYFLGDGPTLVAQVFHEPELPYPPWGLPDTPSPEPPRYLPPKPPQSAKPQQLAWFSEPAEPPPKAPRQDLIALQETAIAQIQAAYQATGFTVTGLSGKDSLTTTLLLLEAIDRLPPAQRKNRVYLITSNTRIENPALITVLQRLHSAILDRAAQRGWPVFSRWMQPTGDQTFWAHVLGRSYPPPNRLARYCTRTLKIDPNDAFMENLSKEHPGQTGLLLLGVRDLESASRSASNARHAQDNFWADHPLPFMRAGTPVRTWTTASVFDFLVEQMILPEDPVYELIALYRHASGGECPLVIEHTGSDEESRTQSIFAKCGAAPGRMGCAYCTVVARDESLESLNRERGGIYDAQLAIQNVLRFLDDPRSGLRTGYQRTRARGVWTQGFGELTPEAVTWLLQLLLDAKLLLDPDELLAIADLWMARWRKGEGWMPEAAWTLLERHRRAHATIPVLSPHPALEVQ